MDSEDQIKAIMKIIKTMAKSQDFKLSSDVFMDIYTAVYNLVIQNNGGVLYEEMDKFLVEMAENAVEIISKKSEDGNIVRLITTYWLNYNKISEQISSLFLYLNERFCERNRLKKTKTLSKHYFTQNLKKHNFLTVFSTTLIKECFSNTSNKSLVLKALQMLQDFDSDHTKFYEELFEREFLRTFTDRYTEMIHSSYESLNTTDFLKKIERVYNEQMARKTIIKTETKDKILKIIRNIMRDVYVTQLTIDKEKGLLNMYDKENLSDLKRFFFFCTGKKASMAAYKTFEEFLAKESFKAASVFREENAPTDKEVEKYMRNVVLSQQKIERVLKASGKSIDWGKHEFKDNSRFAELLAIFIHKLICEEKLRTLQDIEDYNIPLLLILNVDEERLEKQLLIRLEKRLLERKKSPLEIMYLQATKFLHSPNFTSKTLQMLRDIDFSDALNESLSPPNGMKTNIKICTKHLWPLSNQMKLQTLKIPPELNNVKELLYRKYTERFKKLRKLNFVNEFNRIGLKISLPEGVKKVEANLLQASILTLFNDKRKIDFDTIREKVNVEEKVVGDTLTFLVQKGILSREKKKRIFMLNFKNDLNFIDLIAINK